MEAQLYENLGGQHITPDGTRVEHGKTFHSDDPNLCKKFPNKFKRCHIDAPPAQPVNSTPATPVAESEKAVDEKSGPKDVTDEFLEAAKNDLVVEKDSRGWHVRDSDETEAINNKPLKKKEVADFIKKYLA